MSNITFVYASLNNGYDNNPNDPVPNYHFERTVFSVNTLKTKHNANIIFVDWGSEYSKKYSASLAAGIKYVYVPSVINNYLHANNNSTQQFYEWIAKDIGAYFVSTEKIAFVNGDNIFPKKFIENLERLNFTPKQWFGSNRLDISNELFKNTSELLDVIEHKPERLNVLHSNDFCHGDFTLCYKASYDEAGGYPYIHKHAYGDTELISAMAAKGIKQEHFNENFYHLSHSGAGKACIFSESIIDKPYIKRIILENVEVEVV